MDNRPETAPQTPTKIEIALHERRRHGVLKGAIAGFAGTALLGAVFLSQCGGGITTETDAHVTRAEVFSMKPVDVNMRALQKANIRVTVSKTFKTPVDHWPGLGLAMRAVERSSRVSSTFTGRNGNKGGEVDTLIGASDAGVFVSSEPTGKQVVHIPTSSLVEFSAVNLGNSLVPHTDGNMAALGEFEWSVVGGVARSASERVARGRAALDMVAQAEAVNVAQVQCANAAWPLARTVIQEGYRMAAKDTYEAENHSANLHGETMKPFNPADLSVEFMGPKPDFKPAYTLPDGIHVSGNHDHDKITCNVSKDAYTPVSSLTDITGAPVSASVSDYISHEPPVYTKPPVGRI